MLTKKKTEKMELYFSKTEKNKKFIWIVVGLGVALKNNYVETLSKLLECEFGIWKHINRFFINAVIKEVLQKVGQKLILV